jgi:hypothetical protein
MNYKFFSKKGPMLAFSLFLVCVVVSLIPIISGLSEFSTVAPEKQAYVEEGNIFLPGLYLAYGLLWIAVVVAILFSIFQVVKNPKGSMMAIISLAALLVLFFILYSMADPKGTGSVADTIARFDISDGISKMISGGIQMTVFMLLASVLITIVLEVMNFFKNQ